MTLSQIQGVGNATFWSLVQRYGDPKEVLGRSVTELQAVARLSKSQINGFAQIEETQKACRQQLETLVRTGCDVLTYNDEAYPELLREIIDSPPVLYLRGNASLLRSDCVAMVGSRSSSSYGNRTAFSLAKNLSSAGLTIVSGMALGIDAEAHRGALAATGKTIGVLGCGIDVIYPRQHGPLFQDMSECGIIISEYPLGTAPEGFRFPARNRIIAGLSRGVIVVEAARKSGSLITAQMALDFGREVYGVPGQVDSFKSEGVHLLLQQGAKLVLSERDVLEDIGVEKYLQVDSNSPADKGNHLAMSGEAGELLAIIEPYPLSREEILRKSGLEIGRFSEHLLLLELDGLIEMLPGDEIRKIEAG